MVRFRFLIGWNGVLADCADFITMIGVWIYALVKKRKSYTVDYASSSGGGAFVDYLLS